LSRAVDEPVVCPDMGLNCRIAVVKDVQVGVVVYWSACSETYNPSTH
jgi:hypothetical protein